MTQVAPLSVAQLYRVCDQDDLPFRTTDQLAGFKGFFGQERALEAMEFGVGMSRPGYNLFVMGKPHTGRFSFAKGNLDQVAKRRTTPSDWCYLNNLNDRRAPVALQLPSGKARKLRRDVDQLIDNLLTDLPAAFESPAFQRLKGRIEREFNRHYDQAVEAVERSAREVDIAVYRDANSIGFTPMADGKTMDEAQFQSLPEEKREATQIHITELEDQLNEALTEMPQWRREAAEALRKLEHKTVRETLEPLLKPIRERYASIKSVMKYLGHVESDLIRNGADLIGDGEIEAKTDLARRNYLEENYGLNLLVDNEHTKGAPLVFESHPSYDNLFGRIEYSSEMGAVVTNYQQIRAGALHRANGGFLMLEAEKLLEQPFVYEALKRALKSHQISIENPANDFTGLNSVSLNPEPIPLDVKLVLIGTRETYYLLQEYDHDFETMFRVVVDFDEDVPRTSAAVQTYARLLKQLATEEHLAALNRDAVARLVEHSSRLAADQEHLSAHIGSLVDLLCEADYRRRDSGDQLICASHVDAALEAKERRTGRLAQNILDGILNETILIDTEGEAVGKANGLTVLEVGDTSFGSPARITATVHPGSRGIVDIEREVTLGQPIHSKGVLILSGYLGHKYAGDFPLSLSASIALEQSYGYVDGDSASLAEICCLLSALTGVPIKQQFATTGSINQYGEVQAIGGVNEKVEGFFRLCRMRGLTGEQGVIIPRANVRNLMLKREVVAAVEAGKFNLYPVSTVDECLELLTGRPAGHRRKDGQFTQRSLGARIVERLREITRAKVDKSEE